MNDGVVTTALLDQITAVLEAHTETLLHNKKVLAAVAVDVAEIREKLENLQTANPLKSTDEKFIADITARLQAVANTLRVKI